MKDSEGRWESYGEEVCSEMVAFLAEHMGEVCVVVAGYPDKMLHDFSKINPRMPLCFPLQIKLENYSARELTQFLCTFLNAKEPDFVRTFVEPSALKFIYKVIKENKKLLFEFNAGDVKNLASLVFEEMKRRKGTGTKLSVKQAQGVLRRYCVNTKNLKCTFTNRHRTRQETGSNILKVDRYQM